MLEGGLTLQEFLISSENGAFEDTNIYLSFQGQFSTSLKPMFLSTCAHSFIISNAIHLLHTMVETLQPISTPLKKKTI